MRLTKETKAINVITLKDAILKLDSNLGETKAKSVAEYIMKNREYVSATEVLEDLGYEDTGLESDDIDPKWYK